VKAVIIAGGSGTRLRPLTYHTPKPMMPLLDRPFLEYQIAWLRQHGITEIVINLHYLADAIRNVLGNGHQLGVQLHYSLENAPLGTGGAVWHAREFFDEGPIVVLNGDILTDVDLGAVLETHRRQAAAATLTLIRVEDPTAFGLVITEGDRVLRFHEKPTPEEAARLGVNTVNAGIYVLDPAVFGLAPENPAFSFERELFPAILASGRTMAAHVTDRYWIDIGNPRKFLEAQQDLLSGRVRVPPPGREVSPGVWMGPDAEIEVGARIEGPAYIGAGARISAGSSVGPLSIVGAGSRLASGARVSGSWLGTGCIIDRDCVVEGTILGASSVLEPAVQLEHGTVLGNACRLTQGSRMSGGGPA
jgi:NDP-sugar pyrophosphorylase family protein